MAQLLSTLQELNWLSILVRLLLATLCGAIIGHDRGKHGRAAGLRTHVLIALGSCMSSLTGLYMVSLSGFSGDPTRIASGVVSGIGFLCAGMILVKNNSTITGLTTAAAMWTTGTIGLAIGAGFYFAGIIAFAILFICLKVMIIVERRQKKDCRYAIELDDICAVNPTMETISKMYPKAHSFDVQSSKSGLPGHVLLLVNVPEDVSQFTQDILKLEHVLFCFNN